MAAEAWLCRLMLEDAEEDSRAKGHVDVGVTDGPARKSAGCTGEPAGAVSWQISRGPVQLECSIGRILYCGDRTAAPLRSGEGAEEDAVPLLHLLLVRTQCDLRSSVVIMLPSREHLDVFDP